ncbi:hypothetical protein [Billgrantia endophytica]|uniref:hypothetical protein n=1 Tax=Billgrantia endophytica TaxID=2033802 RepID=UPI00197AB316|nr:hypothetical protein [Halomonas endophytica]
MERYATLLLTSLLLFGTLAASATEPAGRVDEAQTVPSSETGEHQEEISTGAAGTTSGITGSDMDQEDQTTGGGQSRGDELFQTEAAATDSGPAYETESPERESPELPDEPLGADLSGHQEDGETQASTEESPD